MKKGELLDYFLLLVFVSIISICVLNALGKELRRVDLIINDAFIATQVPQDSCFIGHIEKKGKKNK